jgi:hypothetical protein
LDIITLGDFTLGKGTFKPGWRWSEDVKPIAGTDSCQVLHTGITEAAFSLAEAPRCSPTTACRRTQAQRSSST